MLHWCVLLQGSRPGQCDQTAAEAILDRFVEAGGNFIDTADIYQQGESETILGQPLPLMLLR